MTLGHKKWFYEAGENQQRKCEKTAKRQRREVATWESVFIKICQKATGADRSCAYTEQPHVWYHQECG